MTRDELAYWGPPAHPVTITDTPDGQPVGMQQGEVFTPTAPSRVGQEHFDAWERQWLVVVWDGAKPSTRGNTKGRILDEDKPFYMYGY